MRMRLNFYVSWIRGWIFKCREVSLIVLDILDGTMRVCTPIKEYHAILKIFRGLLSLINYIGSYAFELVMSVEFLNRDP